MTQTRNRVTKTQAVITPDGQFDTVKAAAEYYGVDRSTIGNRIRRGDPGWSLVGEPRRPRHATINTSQLVWSQYRFMPDSVRSELFAAWCLQQGHEPDENNQILAEQFVFSMPDSVSESTAELDSAIEDLE